MLGLARRLRRAAPIALLPMIGSLAGCNRLRHSSAPTVESAMVTVNIVNHNVLDMTIYMVNRGTRARIGQVTATTRGSFRVRLGQLTGGELQLYADPIGALQGVTSDVVHLVDGQTVEWTLESDLARSFLSVKG